MLISNYSFTQTHKKKNVNANRISNAPIIDGNIDEAVWESTDIATNFIQMFPYNGKPATQKTEVRFIYDNVALYIGAKLYNDSKDSIYTILSERDNLSVTDNFGVYIDPYNDGLTAYGFFITAAGVQVDLKSFEESEDVSWDAVWESKVKISDSCWVVEIKIPYSALRFSKKKDQIWGLNIQRNIQRYNEKSSWNFIDSKIKGTNKQSGELTNIYDIKPPIRLSITPYISGGREFNSITNNNLKSIKGGLDLKYGISENFTLDVMLIPDFGHVQADDKVYNITSFETFYEEKRPFFTEGTELFEMADIFYSRRIGGIPENFYSIELNGNEEITENPSDLQLLNTTKLTGKTQNGWNVGIINAMTQPIMATINDSVSHTNREFTTQAFTNYNVSVINKSLRNNSFVSLINTNMFQTDNGRTANVTGSEFKLANKPNKYAIYGQGAYSQTLTDSSKTKENGYYYKLKLSKISGNFQFTLSNTIINDTYNPNDLGFLTNNNEILNVLELNYNIYKPIGSLLNINNTFRIENSLLLKPQKYKDLRFNISSFARFKNRLSSYIYFTYRPFEKHNYEETRVNGRMFKEPAKWSAFSIISTDYRKKLALDIFIRYTDYINSPYYGYFLDFHPRIRISDKWLMIFQYNLNYDYNAGYVLTEDNNIFFGSRYRTTILNTINLNYIFSNKANLSFRLRHYWSKINYEDYFTLNEAGYLDIIEQNLEADYNFNTFNINLAYTWYFAPGSELSVIWKNEINNNNTNIHLNYHENLEGTLFSPQINSLTIRLLYYIDVMQLRK